METFTLLLTRMLAYHGNNRQYIIATKNGRFLFNGDILASRWTWIGNEIYLPDKYQTNKGV